MKIVPIFMFGETLDEGGLFAAKFDGEVIDEYNKFMDSMFDDSFLYEFFTNNIADISNGYFDYTIDNAIQQTRHEVFNLEASILDIADGGIKNEITLDRLFVALNDYVYEFKPLRTSKARATLIGLKSPWCRLYAIRIDANLYVVTG